MVRSRNASKELIRMQDPLKQGLKRFMCFIPHYIESIIRMQDPLKQGLKLFCGLQGLGDMQFECKIH